MIYEHRCTRCDAVTDHSLSMADRLAPQDCPVCQARDATEYQFAGCTNLGTERKRGNRRLIFDERQVTQEKGKDWRDEGTTRREGGAGRKIHFHQ